MYYEIVADAVGFVAQVRNAQGKLMWSTPSYASKASARNAIAILREHASEAKVDDLTV